MGGNITVSISGEIFLQFISISGFRMTSSTSVLSDPLLRTKHVVKLVLYANAAEPLVSEPSLFLG
jgi:hypothetical protein